MARVDSSWLDLATSTIGGIRTSARERLVFGSVCLRGTSHVETDSCGFGRLDALGLVRDLAVDASSLTLFEVIIVARSFDSLALGRSLHLLEHGFGFRGVPALFTDPSSVLVEDEGERHADQCEQTSDRGTPVDAVLSSNLIHIWRE